MVKIATYWRLIKTTSKPLIYLPSGGATAHEKKGREESYRVLSKD